MKHKNLFYFLLFIGMIAWGGAWVNTKIVSHYVNAYDVIFIRYGIAAISMIPLLYIFKKSFYISFKNIVLVLVASGVLIAYMVYFFLGTKYGMASLGGALVTSLIPIDTFFILALMRVKKIGKKQLFALMIGMLGVLTMLNVWKLNMQEVLVIQNLYFLLAAFLWAVLTIISSKAKHISPLVFTFYMYVVVSVVAGVWLVDFDSIAYESLDSRFWLNMLLMTFGATIFTNTVYFLGVERLGAAEVSSFIFLVPFSAIGLSAIFLHEPISPSMIIGTFMTLYAVKILNNITFFKHKHPSN